MAKGYHADGAGDLRDGKGAFEQEFSGSVEAEFGEALNDRASRGGAEDAG